MKIAATFFSILCLFGTAVHAEGAAKAQALNPETVIDRAMTPEPKAAPSKPPVVKKDKLGKHGKSKKKPEKARTTEYRERV